MAKKNGSVNPLSSLRRRIRMLAQSNSLTKEQLRVAMYALTKLNVGKMRHVRVEDFAVALSMKANNVSRALTFLEHKLAPRFLSSEMDGRNSYRKLLPIKGAHEKFLPDQED